jgi:hypothetical protein
LRSGPLECQYNTIDLSELADVHCRFCIFGWEWLLFLPTEVKRIWRPKMTVSSTRTTVVSNLSNFVGHICAVLRFVPYKPGFIVLLTPCYDYSANRYFGLLQYVKSSSFKILSHFIGTLSASPSAFLWLLVLGARQHANVSSIADVCIPSPDILSLPDGYLWEPVGGTISTLISQVLLGSRVYAVCQQCCVPSNSNSSDS